MNDRPMGTILESDDEIKKAQAALRKQADANGGPSSDPEKKIKRARTFRPTHRPPVAMLTICDDGASTGEVVRIRDEQFIVGRTEGDLKLQFDELLSTRHFAITRQIVKGQWRCVVTDLQSKNGVFFRVAKAPLPNQTEFLVGQGCYQHQLNQSSGPVTTGWNDQSDRPPGTRALEAEQNPGLSILTEVVRGASGQRISLTKDSYTIGSSTTCDIVRPDDPFVEQEHAVLKRSEKGTWVIENQQARNGVWVRLPQIGIQLNSKCDFQAGEQRFKLTFGVAR